MANTPNDTSILNSGTAKTEVTAASQAVTDPWHGIVSPARHRPKLSQEDLIELRKRQGIGFFDEFNEAAAQPRPEIPSPDYADIIDMRADIVSTLSEGFSEAREVITVAVTDVVKKGEQVLYKAKTIVAAEATDVFNQIIGKTDHAETNAASKANPHADRKPAEVYTPKPSEIFDDLKLEHIKQLEQLFGLDQLKGHEVPNNHAPEQKSQKPQEDEVKKQQLIAEQKQKIAYFARQRQTSPMDEAMAQTGVGADEAKQLLNVSTSIDINKLKNAKSAHDLVQARSAQLQAAKQDSGELGSTGNASGRLIDKSAGKALLNDLQNGGETQMKNSVG